jgi:hypothetical protein
MQEAAIDPASQPKRATYFLTWHGTLLRIDRASRRLVHARLWPERDSGRDWHLELPGGIVAAPMPSPEDARVTLRPAESPHLVTMERDGAYLCAEPNAGEVRFSRPHTGPWEVFLAVTAQNLAALRSILGHGWMDPDHATDRLRASIETGMSLVVGGARANLRHGIPHCAAHDETIRLVENNQTLTRATPLALGAEIELTRRPPHAQAQVVADLAALRATPDTRLNLPGEPEYGYVPLAAGRDDETWMLRKWSQPGERRLGPLRNACQLVRETDKFVLLQRWREGLIFDARGASNETGYLMGLNVTEPGLLAREGDRIFVSQAVLDQAPRLAGPHAVFYGGNLSNYYHWTVDALLPLHVMAPLLPAGTKLLMPATLRAFRELPPDQAAREVDHLAALQAWGFGDWPQVEIDGPVCHVDEVYWLDQCFIEQMPAQFVQAARADVLARLGPAGPQRNIYITRERTRNVANKVLVEAVLRKHGFSVHALEGMTPLAQMELFRDAACVVAPHGAGLANLLFCAPGTKVLELSPDCEFRPLFAQISDKLDLAHAVLPCPTDDGGFFGRMTVDVPRLRMLLRQLLARQEAA